LYKILRLSLARSSADCCGKVTIAFSTANRIAHDETPLIHRVEALNEQHLTIDQLFTAVVEVAEEAVINALSAAHTQSGRNNHRAEALPLDETLAILRRYERV